MNWKAKFKLSSISDGRQWWLWVKGIDLDCCFGSGLRCQLIRSRNLVAKSNGCVGNSSLGVLGYCKNCSHTHVRLFRGWNFGTYRLGHVFVR